MQSPSLSSKVKPFRQQIRIWVLRSYVVILLPLLVFTRSAWDHPEWLFDMFEVAGIFLVIAGVLGRFWSILYIGGRKNKEVMDQGPYSMCRHPLYLFSTLAVLGFGLMMGSLVLTVILGGGIFLILSMTASKEEAFLRQEFGEAYRTYAARVPRILPKPSLFHTDEEVTFNVKQLRTNLADALVFLATIPLAEAMEGIHESGLITAIPLW